MATRLVRMATPAATGETFDPEIADSLIGTETEFEGRPARVVEARVVKAGKALHFTLEVEWPR